MNIPPVKVVVSDPPVMLRARDLVAPRDYTLTMGTLDEDPAHDVLVIAELGTDIPVAFIDLADVDRLFEQWNRSG